MLRKAFSQLPAQARRRIAESVRNLFENPLQAPSELNLQDFSAAETALITDFSPQLIQDAREWIREEDSDE